MPHGDRNPILKAFIEKQEETIKRLEAQLTTKRREVFEASGPISDSLENEKCQCREQAFRIEEQIASEKDCLEMLLALPNPCEDRVVLGSMVTLKNGKECITCIIVPKDGGRSVCVEGSKITCVSVRAPLGKTILNLGKGDKATLPNGLTYEIISVQ